MTREMTERNRFYNGLAKDFWKALVGLVVTAAVVGVIAYVVSSIQAP